MPVRNQAGVSAWDEIKDWGDRLAGGPAAVPVTAMDGDRRISKAAAWAVLLGLYGLFFGRGTFVALQILLSGEAGTPAVWSLQRNVESTVKSVAFIVLIVVVALFVLRGLRISTARAGLSLPTTRAAWRREFRIGAVSQTMAFFGFAAAVPLAGVFGGPDFVYPVGDLHTNLDWLSELASSLAAGPAEELLLVLLLVWLLRGAGHSWTVICIAAVVLRVLFHLYYGWAAVGLAIWPLMVIYLYKRSGAIWGIIIAHSLFNVFGTLSNMAEQSFLGQSAIVVPPRSCPSAVRILKGWASTSGSAMPCIHPSWISSMRISSTAIREVAQSNPLLLIADTVQGVTNSSNPCSGALRTSITGPASVMRAVPG